MSVFCLIKAERLFLHDFCSAPACAASPKDSDQCEGFTYLRFEIRTSGSGSIQNDNPSFLTVVQDGKIDSSSSTREGLGFAICKKFTQLMHGNIWLEANSKGEGSVVTFLIRVKLQTSTANKH